MLYKRENTLDGRPTGDKVSLSIVLVSHNFESSCILEDVRLSQQFNMNVDLASA
jgi:hypothetical protein